MIVPIVNECAWRARLDTLPEWRPPLVPTVVVAPHPDDETLGAGGLIAALRASGVPVTVVAVTDGENAYGITPGLGAVRRQEQTSALECLGVGLESIQRLRLPDSGLTGCEGLMVKELLPLVSAEMHVVAPWVGDFHPDHEACGRAAKAGAERVGAQLTSYLFWTWHRGTPELLDGLGAVRFPLAERELLAKRGALACHRSQLEHASGEPILPEYLLEPARRPFEVYLPGDMPV